MNFDEVIDAVYCINLDSRPDRWEKVEKNFSELGIQLIRVPAVDGSTLDLPDDTKHIWNKDIHHNERSIGCASSHIRCMEMALESSGSRFLFIEDDAQPCKDFLNLFLKAWQEVPENAPFVYLGGSNLEAPAVPISERVSASVRTKSTVAYSMTREFISGILPMLREKILFNAIDELYCQLQTYFIENKSAVLILNPRLIYQYDSYSDIINCEVTYPYLKDIE